MKLKGLDHYERRALHDIQAWVDGDRGPLDGVLRTIGSVTGGARVGRAVDAVMGDPRVTETIGVALAKGMDALSSFMVATTPQDTAAIAYGLQDPGDIAGLHLEVIDERLQQLRRRHRRAFAGLGAVEGAASFSGPVGGIAAFVASVPAMQALSLRAVADVSRHTGFDPADFGERRFIAEVTFRSLDVGGRSHADAVNTLVGIGQQVATRQAMDQLQQMAAVNALRNQARRFGLVLTRRWAAALLPVIGAVAGAGFNTLHAERLMSGSIMLFRARHLSRTHGLPLDELITPSANAA